MEIIVCILQNLQDLGAMVKFMVLNRLALINQFVLKITNENEKLLEREIIILKKLIEFDNPHLIKIYDISKQNNQLLIFMERCQQTLGDYITKNKQQKQLLSLFEIIDLAKQIINGYRDLYSHNIIHRDLKPENLLQIRRLTIYNIYQQYIIMILWKIDSNIYSSNFKQLNYFYCNWNR